MNKVYDGNMVSIIDERCKTISLNIYNYVKSFDTKDEVYLDVIINVLNRKTDNLSTTDFLKIQSNLYSPKLNIRLKSFADYNVMIYELKYIDPNILKEVDEDSIINLFNDYISQSEINIDDFNNFKREYVNYLNYFKTQYDELSFRYLEDLTFNQSTISLEDEITLVEQMTIEDVKDFLSKIKVTDQFQINISKDKSEIYLLTHELNTVLKRKQVTKFEDLEIDLYNDQASIKLLYKYDKIPYYKMQVFNIIYGGDVSSKLFKNVREKKQYAYSVYSNILEKQALLVSIETKRENIDNAISSINQELESMRNISENDLEKSKDILISNIRQYSKDLRVVKSTLEEEKFYNSKYDLEQKINNIRSVTLKDIKEITNSLTFYGKVVIK